MTEEYVGCQVSVEVGGGLGFYQGKVVAINTERQTLTLTQVIHNGRPAPLSEVTINAGDVRDLKILSRSADTTLKNTTSRPLQPEAPSQKPTSAPQPYTSQPNTTQTFPPDHYKQPPQQYQSQQPPQQQSTQRTAKILPVGHGTVVGGAGTGAEGGQIRRKPRASVGETLAHGSHQPFPRDGTGEWQQMGQGQPPPTDYSSPRRSDPARTPNKKERQRRARNEATFGTPIDDMLTTEFDFESNLALFDKQLGY